MAIKPIPAQFQQFLVNYVNNGGNIKKAGLDAGYTPSYTRSNLITQFNKLETQQLLKDAAKSVLTDQMADRLKITLSDKCEYLRAVIQKSIDNDLKDGSKTALALRAIDMLNRIQGHYAATQSVNVHANLKDVEEKIKDAKKAYDEF